MSSEERLQAAIRLEPPDRVPVAPMIYYFAAFYAGITVHELWSDWKKYELAIQKCFRELGPWDIYYNICPYSPEAYQACLMMKVKYPGVDLEPDNICQFDEYEMMLPEDYDWILDYPGSEALLFSDHTLHILAKFLPGFAGEGWKARARLAWKIAENFLRWRLHFRWWRAQGVAILSGSQSESPFDQFSMSRSMQPFTYDLADRPEKVKAAARRLARPFARTHILLTRLSGVPRMLLYVHRSSTDFISPKIFAEISLPPLQEICELLIQAGVTPILHCDGNWDKNLKHLRQLPPQKCIIQFDGPTDIFRAKQEIGDIHCLFGDVNAYDLVMGSPSQIDEYCHRLIEEVGRGGGFILAAGCEIPPNAKPENVKAMIQAPRKYQAPA
ncbi:MAG: hypothetical protein A2V67_08505 [Deltaproteobacteria bacterium RBG_13_61_14]|nr:MAG: hypothetical protein A2V67_08505 [Deltaproteobacteria bacterium RBG_13_61_14]